MGSLTKWRADTDIEHHLFVYINTSLNLIPHLLSKCHETLNFFYFFFWGGGGGWGEKIGGGDDEKLRILNTKVADLFYLLYFNPQPSLTDGVLFLLKGSRGVLTIVFPGYK